MSKFIKLFGSAPGNTPADHYVQPYDVKAVIGAPGGASCDVYLDTYFDKAVTKAPALLHCPRTKAEEVVALVTEADKDESLESYTAVRTRLADAVDKLTARLDKMEGASE